MLLYDVMGIRKDIKNVSVSPFILPVQPNRRQVIIYLYIVITVSNGMILKPLNDIYATYPTESNRYGSIYDPYMPMCLCACVCHFQLDDIQGI